MQPQTQKHRSVPTAVHIRPCLFQLFGIGYGICYLYLSLLLVAGEYLVKLKLFHLRCNKAYKRYDYKTCDHQEHTEVYGRRNVESEYRACRLDYHMHPSRKVRT